MPARAWKVVALCALGVAFAWPMQVNGFNQTAHYALVRSLAKGTPNIDKSRGEVGELSTGDAAMFEGHWYAAKPPGLAALTVPAFYVVEAIGMRSTGDPTRVIWALHLWSIVIPALLLAVAVGWAAERLARGWGVAVAVVTGLGTLVLPYATLFFSHVTSAALGVAAFALLWRERDGPGSPKLAAAAGLLAGVAVVVEYPLVFVTALLGLYVLTRAPRLRRAAAYAAGAAVGVLPLLAFNTWAFGSPTHIAHEDFFQSPEHESEGVFLGFSLPSASQAWDLTFSTMGMLVLTPVLALGVAAAISLARRERRAEAAVVLGVAAAYLLYNASLRSVSPFGGLGPPRYLITLIPFVAIPLALAFRRLPLATIALAVVSIVQMALVTATGALPMYDGAWFDRFRSRQFVETAAAVVEITGWYAILPFFLAVLAAAFAAAAASPRIELSPFDATVAAAALGAWVLAALVATNPSGLPLETGYVLAVAGAGAAAATGVALAAVRASQNVTAAPIAKNTAEHSGQVSA
jgi:4-amino-4-deoxy-L-arabinose transferase-like glycosyltransferase